MRSVALACVLLGCGAALVEDAPEPSPRPAPLRPYVPEPAACAGACAHAVDLGCVSDADRCRDACERYEQEAYLAPELGWQPACIVEAQTCDAVEACREAVR